MANIARIDVRLLTGTKNGIGSEGPGTDGDVYIGIAGREFFIDTTADDFERGADKNYVLGDGANVNFREFNDPREPQLSTDDLGKFPVYLRFEPGGSNPDWNVERVRVTVNPGRSEIRFDNVRLAGLPDIWLGQRMGKTVHLTRV